MLTIYSAVQQAHRPAYGVKQGERSSSFDVPERIGSILSAINEKELGPVIAPDDAGLEPIRTVHDAGTIEYLATAYEQQNTEAKALPPVFPTFFPPPGQRRRPDCFEGQKGFYCTNTGVPIDQNTWKVALASAHCATTGARSCCTTASSASTLATWQTCHGWGGPKAHRNAEGGQHGNQNRRGGGPG